MAKKSLDRQLEEDLEWREGELAIFRELLSNRDNSDLRKRALFRAAWALLYAHYEGYSKFCLDVYLQHISEILTHCLGLPDQLFVFLIEDEIRRVRSLPSDQIFSFFMHDVSTLRTKAPLRAQVDTKSNLWPDMLEHILRRLDLATDCVVNEKRKLSTLVARRNDIAHGRKVFIDNIVYYSEYEDAALNTMYGLALTVVERAEAIEMSCKSQVV